MGGGGCGCWGGGWGGCGGGGRGGGGGFGDGGLGLWIGRRGRRGGGCWGEEGGLVEVRGFAMHGFIYVLGVGSFDLWFWSCLIRKISISAPTCAVVHLIRMHASSFERFDCFRVRLYVAPRFI